MICYFPKHALNKIHKQIDTYSNKKISIQINIDIHL